MNLEDLQIDPEEFRRLFTGEIQYPKEISLYLDESSSHRAKSLWSEGITVTTVEEQGQKGQPSDFRVLAHARKLGCILITRDKHFIHINDIIQNDENASHAGIILVKSKQARNDPFVVIEFVINFAASVDYSPDALENIIVIL